MELKIIKMSQDLQKRLEGRIKHIGKGKYGRVLKMSVYPTSEEFSKTLQITGLGIILIGGLGFVIYLLWGHIFPALKTFLGL